VTNPLLHDTGLPAFDAILPEHVGPAVSALLADAAAALERAVGSDVPATYAALCEVLDVATERLDRAWSAVGHLNAVVNTPALRAAYNDSLPAVTDFHTRLGADTRLYAKYKAVAANDGTLTPAQRRALDLALRDFVLSGAELTGVERERFAAIQARKAALSQAFSEHVLDATDAFALDVEESQLAGLPPDALAAAQAAAQAAGATGGRLTLQGPSYLAAMRHLQDRSLRETLYRAYVTRASELGPEALDNSAAIAELLTLRQEEARLLGFENFAQLSLARKMASSPDAVCRFVRDLASRGRPHALRDLNELTKFAAGELGLVALQPWDVPYAAERLRESRYAYSEQETKAYFPLPKVLDGLFQIIQTLFGVTIREDAAPVWHDNVRVFRIERAGATADGAPALVAQFYLDLYARAGKRSGAWMGGVRSRWQRPGAGSTLQTPAAHLVCNFAAPQGDQPALLTHDNVITLFHEFGHGLHHMLTAVGELGVSGISGVEWDAVELPSQFMENFCWEWEAVRRMTTHVSTGAPLPRTLFDKMLAARNFHSGLQLLRQAEFALFDMRLHAEPGTAGRVQPTLQEVNAEIGVLPLPPFARTAHSFGHIFAGGYAAGYYSYKWAEVLSADAFGAFEESGVFSGETGRRFLREILETGGSRPALESFRAFRGRDPQIDALLRHNGMT
jgi:oligopeptidase A